MCSGDQMWESLLAFDVCPYRPFSRGPIGPGHKVLLDETTWGYGTVEDRRGTKLGKKVCSAGLSDLSGRAAQKKGVREGGEGREGRGGEGRLMDTLGPSILFFVYRPLEKSSSLCHFLDTHLDKVGGSCTIKSKLSGRYYKRSLGT